MDIDNQIRVNAKTSFKKLLNETMIKEIFDRSNEESIADWKKGIRYETSYEKFAELIVRECAEQIVAKGTDWVDFAPSQTGVRPEYWAMAQQIKEHFGVEE